MVDCVRFPPRGASTLRPIVSVGTRHPESYRVVSHAEERAPPLYAFAVLEVVQNELHFHRRPRPRTIVSNRRVALTSFHQSCRFHRRLIKTGRK